MALALLAGVVPAPVTWAQPAGPEAGGVSILFQFHNNSTQSSSTPFSNPLFTLATPTLSDADLRIDSYEFIPNWGTLKTSMDLSHSNGSLQAGRGMIELSDFHWRGFQFDFTFGDHPLTVYNLDFGLNALFNPFANLRGGRITASNSRMALTFFGGRVASTSGVFGESMQLTDQTLFGVRGSFNLSSKLKVGTSLVHMDRTEPSRDLSIPGSSSVWAADAIYQVNSKVQLMGETSVSHFSEAPNRERPNGFDGSYLFGTKVKTRRGSGEISWVRLSPNYLPLTRFNVGDREGVFSSAEYEITQEFFVYGALNRFHNNLSEAHSQSTLEVDNQFIGVRYLIHPRSTLNVRFGNAGVNSRENDPNLVRSRSRTLDVDFSQQIRSWRAVFRYSENRNQDFTSRTEHSLRRRVEVEVRKNWKNGTNVWASVGNLREVQEGEGKLRSSVAGSAGLNWIIRPSVSLYSEFNWNQDISVLRTSSFSSRSFNGGVNWVLPKGMQLSVNGQYNRTLNSLSLLDTLTLTPDNLAEVQNLLLSQQFNRYQIGVRFMKNFKWGHRPEGALAHTAGDASPGKPREFGNIEGVVFNDLNADGKIDPGERGVSHLTLVLDKKFKTPADAEGKFEFRNVPVGMHSVDLELLSLPAQYDAGATSLMVVSVAKRMTSHVKFPLLQLGKIAGRVVLVDALSKSTEAKNLELPGANFIILLNETYKVTFTDADGEFEFNNIPAGQYRVRIDPGTLPDFTVLASEAVMPVTLKPGSKASNLKFVVEVKPRPNKTLLIASQTIPSMPGAAQRKEAGTRRSKRRTSSKTQEQRMNDSLRLDGRLKPRRSLALPDGEGPEIKSLDAPLEPRKAKRIIHEVQAGDTLWSLALQYYGAKNKWTLIYNANRDRVSSSKRLRAGQRLRIPIVPESAKNDAPEKTRAALISPPEHPSATAENAANRKAGNFVIHEVQWGETLQSLALLYFQSKEKWTVIYRANSSHIAASRRLRAGQKLKIPVERNNAAGSTPPRNSADPVAKKVAANLLKYEFELGDIFKRQAGVSTVQQP